VTDFFEILTSGRRGDGLVARVDDGWEIRYENGDVLLWAAKPIAEMKRQDDWIDYFTQLGKEKTENVWWMPTLKDEYDLQETLNRALTNNNPAAVIQAAEALKKQRNEDYTRWMMTADRVRYAPTGNDVLIQNAGHPAATEQETSFKGRNGYIIRIPVEGLEEITGRKASAMNAISKHFTAMDTYHWRLENTSQIIECPVRVGIDYFFVIFSDFGVDALYGGYGGVRPVRWLRREKIE
jgi:hypothetical protein